MSQPVDYNLIYDVGMHVGTDSAYYLKRGYKVVAIEANPTLAAQARSGFASEVANGRLTVLDVGIAGSRGEETFWVCDDWTAWSSFDRSVASRNGNRHHAVSVQLRPLHEIFDEYGLPYYCKVDIEGNDKYCLDGLSADFRPLFMSVEFSEYPFLERMAEVGFDRFKLIHQLSFSTPTPRWHAARRLIPHAKLQAGLERCRGLARGALFDGRWYFKIGSSGPVPFDSPRGWWTYEQAREMRDYVTRQFASGAFGLLDSFDLHATDAQALMALQAHS
jgi:FkbM family methyltransferase